MQERIKRKVWDTSSLSHAFEDLAHASVTSYAEANRKFDFRLLPSPEKWMVLKRRLWKRFKSEHQSRLLLLECDETECLIPPSVLQELLAEPRIHDQTVLLTHGGEDLEYAYMKKRGLSVGFSHVFRPSLTVKHPSPVTTEKVALVEKKMVESGELPHHLSRQDLDGIALALDTNGTLITADRNQCLLAKKLGVNVIYTIGRNDEC